MSSDKNYYNKDYNINPKIRELMEKKVGKKFDLSFVHIEKIISDLRTEYNKSTYQFTEIDKNRLISNLKENSPNSFTEALLTNVNMFLKDVFTEEQIKSYLDYCIYNYYNPSKIYNGIRVSNKGIIKLLSLSGLHTMKDGIIINKKYINDLINFFDKESSDFNFDKDTLMVYDDLTNDMVNVFNEIKGYNNLKYYTNDEIFIIVSNDDISTRVLKQKFKGLEIQKILDLPYYDTQELESDTMDLGNGMVMKGNFTNIGNVNGTQIIGVGSGGSDSQKEDALDMITRIMNGDMSRCGHDEDEED